jgi:Amt family ammonium transporter
MLLAVLGTLFLAFGWYGFNVGTQATVLAAADGSLTFNGGALGQVVMNTTLGMGAGAVAAMLVSAAWQGKPDPLWAANGLLAGLVAVTGAVPHVTWWGGIILGGIAGALVLPTYRWVVDSLKIDDVCGVFAVHGSAGAIGTILIPVFGVTATGGYQFLGVDQLIMQVVGRRGYVDGAGDDRRVQDRRRPLRTARLRRGRGGRPGPERTRRLGLPRVRRRRQPRGTDCEY